MFLSAQKFYLGQEYLNVFPTTYTTRDDENELTFNAFILLTKDCFTSLTTMTSSYQFKSYIDIFREVSQPALSQFLPGDQCSMSLVIFSFAVK